MTIVKQKSGINHTTQLAVISMLAALAAGLMFIEFPLPFIAPSFYEFDFSEVPVLVGTYSMGPVAGVIIELVKILVKFLIKGTSTGGVGELANFIIGCSLILPAGPFNIVKGLIISLIVFFIYKPLSNLIRSIDKMFMKK